MKIAFVCIDSDLFAIGQVLKVCDLLVRQLDFNEEQLMILRKPVRKIKKESKKSEKDKSFKRYIKRILRKRTLKSLINSVRYRCIVKTNHVFVKKGMNRLTKINSGQINTINSEQTIKCLKEYGIDNVIFVYYDEIVRAHFLSNFSCFNVHPGLLPEYRGCQPLYWQLKESQPVSAITVHRMTEGLDEGDIIAEIPFTIYPEKSNTYNVMNTGFYSFLGNALFIAIRRLYLFDDKFGIPQKLSKGKCTYYSRPQR